MMVRIVKHVPGVLLCLTLAIPAWFLGKVFPIIGGPVFGILFGMVAIMLFSKISSTERSVGIMNTVPVMGSCSDGIKYTSKKVLQYAIILLGFQMNVFNVIQVGGQSLLVMAFTLSASFFTAYLIGSALRLHGNMLILIGVGTSICGGSAIAATAPVIQAEDEDVAHALSTIFLFNIVAVFIFPLLGHLLGMGDYGFGMWAGTAINDTSSVVAASVSWSAAAGNDTALTFATIVKLTRTLMIVPITLVLALYMIKKKHDLSEGSTYKFSRIFPWFIIGFVVAAIINTFIDLPQSVSHTLVTCGKFGIVMAMAAIGLNTHLKKLIANGFKPIFLGFCCWLAVASMSLAVQALIKMW